MTRSRQTMRESGHGRVEAKVTEADRHQGTELPKILDRILSMDMEITKNYDRSSSSESDHERGMEASKKDGDKPGACNGGHKKGQWVEYSGEGSGGIFRDELWSQSGARSEENKHCPAQSSNTRSVGERPPASERTAGEGGPPGEPGCC